MTRRTRCHCQICVPERLSDPQDKACVQNVRRYGVHILAVGTGPCDCEGCDSGLDEDDGPAFAYTVGLPHHSGHPELVVSGLRVELMHSMLNSAAERVLQGFRFEPGTTAESLIGFWPVVADPMSPVGLAETVICSRWFHRGTVDALQLVWPSTSGVFSWQPGGSTAVAAAQPEHWRMPQERLGCLAPDPDWPFPVAADQLVVTCRHVAEEGAPVHDVVRLAAPDGEQWQFFCPLESHDPDQDMCAYHFAHLARGVPSLRDLADLRPGEEAVRASCWSPRLRRRAQLAA